MLTFAIRSVGLLCLSVTCLLSLDAFAQAPVTPTTPAKSALPPSKPADGDTKTAQQKRTSAQIKADLKEQARLLELQSNALKAAKAKQSEEPTTAPASDVEPLASIDAPADAPTDSPTAPLQPSDATDPSATPESADPVHAEPTSPRDESVQTPPEGATPQPTPAGSLEQLQEQVRILIARVNELQATTTKQGEEIAAARAAQAAQPLQPDASAEQPAQVDPQDPTAMPANDGPSPVQTQPNASAEQPAQSSETATEVVVVAVAVEDPFSNPAAFRAELGRRYAERFGSAASHQPISTFDFDDFSLSMSRWSTSQNRILSQPIDWTVRVVRTGASKRGSEQLLLVCQAVDDDQKVVGNEFQVEIDRSTTDQIVRSNPRGTLFQLAGVIDPKISFSGEHAKDDTWHRTGTFVGPYCVSNWIIEGQHLTPRTQPSIEQPVDSATQADVPSEPSPS